MPFPDRGKKALSTFILKVMSYVNLFPMFEARVVRQNGDGTVDVVSANDPSILNPFSNLSRVPLFYGVPGLKAELVEGSLVLLGFLRGDPSRPFIVSWGSGERSTSAKWEIPNPEVVIGRDSRPVSRVDDEIEVTIPSGTLIMEAAPPAGGPILTGTPIVLTGRITQGSPKLKAGD